jgi:hypothetical protein
MEEHMAHRSIVLERSAPIAGRAWREIGSRLCSAVAIALAAGLVAACGGGGDGDPPDAAPDAPRVTSITVSPPDPRVGVGLSQALSAQARDQYGAVMAGVEFTWQTTDAAVAVVDKGVVTGVAAGSATITAASDGVTSNAAVLSVVAVATGVVVIDKPSVFLTASGQGARLTAQVLDEQGVPVPGTVRWTSSTPGQVSVDANGQLQALVAAGSATIVAEAGGIRSAPTLVVVATPQTGALLVTDAQVVAVGALQPRAGGAIGPGSHYEVTLRDIAAPLPGTIVIAAESAPVAGKVVATRSDAAGLVTTLELLALPQLFSAYDIRLDVDLSRFGMEEAPDRAQAAAARGIVWNAARRQQALASRSTPLDAFDPFRAWRCNAELEPQLVGKPISLSLENNLRLTLEDRPGYSKHALEGSAEIVGSAGLKLKAGFRSSGRCDAQGQVRLPVFGWVSAIVMPAVRFGIGAELESEILLVQGELGVEGRIGLAPSLGWECGGATPECRGLDGVTLTDRLKTKSKMPSENDMQAKISAHFYVVAGLDASILLGAFNAEIVEARLGPKQSFDLAFEEDQAAREDYASSYDLKLEGVIEPGSALAEAIKAAIGDSTTSVTFRSNFAQDISESPKGTLAVSKTRVAPDSPVDFTVDLAPTSSLEYWQLGYNVTGLHLYRRAEGETQFTPWKAMNQIASNRASYRWTPTEADAGKYEFAAFVNTQVSVPMLEVAANSIRKVEVTCFSEGSRATAARAQPHAPTCSATYVGSADGERFGFDRFNASITWELDRERMADPGRPSGLIFYKPKGSVSVEFLVYTDAGCSVTPRDFNRFTAASMLTVDYAQSPPAYGFGLYVAEDLTINCPGNEPFLIPEASVLAISGNGNVNDSGNLVFQTASSVARYSYSFAPGP